jgi:outer membrane murein-binding lipoprotein Lpp
MHEAPALRRWGVRLGLAVIVAIAIGYLPGQALRRDPRAVKLESQLEELRAHAREVAAGNAVLARDVQALRTDVHAIEDRARADLGMVYPDEVVLEVRHDEVATEARHP